MNVFSRGIRNAFRNGIRTTSIVLILSLSIGLALSMLAARQAVDQKITSVKSSIGNSISVTPAGVQGFEGGGEPLTADQIAKITSTNHVTGAVSTLSDRLTTENTSLVSSIEAGSLGRRFNSTNDSSSNSDMPTPPTSPSGSTRSFTPPITVTGTNDSSTVSSIGAVTLTSGTQIDASSDENVALLGAAIATKNNLTAGSTFTAYGTTITVKGIIDTANSRFAGNMVIMPLKTLQRLSDQAGSVTSVTVTVDSVENTDATVTSLKNTLGTSADVVSEASTAEQALSPLSSIKDVSLFALIAAGISAAVIILLTMIMIVRERRREIGVLKAIGASDTKVSLQFMTEAATFTVLAAIIGILIALIASGPITTLLVNNANSSSTQSMGRPGRGLGQEALRGITNIRSITATVDWHLIMYGLGAALLIAVIGALVSAWFITKVRPAEAVRAE